MFVIMKKERRPQYAAEPGLARSYTARLSDARRFATYEGAKAEACGNEIVMHERQCA